MIHPAMASPLWNMSQINLNPLISSGLFLRLHAILSAHGQQRHIKSIETEGVIQHKIMAA